MKNTKDQLELMTAEMNQLKMEKAQLETRTRILEQVVKLNTVHEARLHATSVSPVLSWRGTPGQVTRDPVQAPAPETGALAVQSAKQSLSIPGGFCMPNPT